MPRSKAYLSAIMKRHRKGLVVPGDYPELRLLAWNRDVACPITREEAFELYDRNWRHVDAAHLTRAEADLIDALSLEFGPGSHRPA